MSTFADLGVPADFSASSTGPGSPTLPDPSGHYPRRRRRQGCLRPRSHRFGQDTRLWAAHHATVAKAKPGRPRALVLAPTRELAEQIRNDLAPFAKARQRWVGHHLRGRLLREAAQGVEQGSRRSRRMPGTVGRSDRPGLGPARRGRDGGRGRGRPDGGHGVPPRGEAFARPDAVQPPDHAVLGDARWRDGPVDPPLPAGTGPSRSRHRRARRYRRQALLLAGGARGAVGAHRSRGGRHRLRHRLHQDPPRCGQGGQTTRPARCRCRGHSRRAIAEPAQPRSERVLHGAEPGAGRHRCRRPRDPRGGCRLRDPFRPTAGRQDISPPFGPHRPSRSVGCRRVDGFRRPGSSGWPYPKGAGTGRAAAPSRRHRAGIGRAPSRRLAPSQDPAGDGR